MRKRISRTIQKRPTPQAAVGSGDHAEAESRLAADRLLDEKESAARLGLSIRTLQKWRLAGCGPRFVKMGRAVRYAEAELHYFIRTRERASTSA